MRILNVKNKITHILDFENTDEYKVWLKDHGGRCTFPIDYPFDVEKEYVYLGWYGEYHIIDQEETLKHFLIIRYEEREK